MKSSDVVKYRGATYYVEAKKKKGKMGKARLALKEASEKKLIAAMRAVEALSSAFNENLFGRNISHFVSSANDQLGHALNQLNDDVYDDRDS